MGYLVASDIPNLISGVSQQPWNVRLPTQAEEQINCMSSVTDFLKRRPATRHVATLRSTPITTGCAVHAINRDETEKYVCLFTSSGVEVFDLNGNRKTVHNQNNGLAYLSGCNPEADLRFLTIGDYTFVVNRRRLVSAGGGTSAARSPEALVFIKQASYNTTYKVNAGGTTASFTTLDGVAPADQPADELSSLQIAQSLASQLGSLSAGTVGNVIWLRSSSSFTVKAEDSRANTHISVCKNKVQRFSDLPVIAPNGFQVEIAGDASSSFDNYYCRFETNDGSWFGQGTWKETIKPGIKMGFNSSTMPHALIRNADGTFTFTPLNWANRVCGDDISSPMPSFVGRRISNLLFYRNRLCFLSEENMIMSEAGEFFNFFPTTATTLVDSDPIDVAASHARSSALESAVIFAGGLLLFSEQCQFTLEHDNVLSASTISIRPVTEFEASVKVQPVSSGKTVFFAVEHGQYAGIREYITLPETSEQNDATDVTAHVPHYIPGRVRSLCCSTNEDILLVRATGAASGLYVYKYFWNGSEKIQSAWSRFQMCGDVLGMFFVNTRCYLVMQYADGICLEVMDFAQGSQDAGARFEYCLDRKITEANLVLSAYDEENDTTSVTFPWIIPGDLDPVVALRPDVQSGSKPEEGDFILKSSSADRKTFTFQGNLTGKPLFAGVPYKSAYTFSTFALRENGKSNAITGGRLQLRKLILNCDRTGFLQIRVSPDFRDDSVYTFTGKQLGHGSNILAALPLYTGKITCPLLSMNTQVRISVESGSFLPFAVVNASWEGFYNSRDRRA